MTIYERVLAYLKEQPGNPDEIAEALGLAKRDEYGSFYWGKWRFGLAEMRGLIEWKDERWHLKEAEGGEDKEVRGSMVRTPSILMGELERDFDEIALGKAQKEDWRIEMGLSDARRDLKELWRAITEAEG